MMANGKVNYFEVCPEIIEAAMKKKRIEEFNKKVEGIFKREMIYGDEEDGN